MTTNLPVTANDLVGALSKTVTRRSNLDDGMSYLRLNKGGIWIYGSDDVEVEPESLWAVNPSSFAEGYICWGDSEVLGEEMVSISADPILLSTLPDLGRPWQAQCAMQLVCVSGEDKGTQVVYKTSSKGGTGRFKEFLQQFLIHLEANPGTDKFVPVVELLEDSYKHKKYGTIFKPIFQIKEWLTMDDDSYNAPSGNTDDSDADPSEPVSEPAKPARRRRRKAA
jgi:hypothetical protein